MLRRALSPGAAAGKIEGSAASAEEVVMPFAHRRSSFVFAAACLVLLPLSSIAADGAQDEAERKVAAAVFGAYNKMLEAKFAVDIQSTDDKGNQAKALAEYESLSRFHVKTDRLEIVSLPEGSWVKADQAGWTRSPAEMAAMVKQFVPKSAAELQASSSNLKDEGPTTWNGQAAHAYSYDTRMQVMGADVKAHNKVVIDQGGRLVRSESDGESMGIRSHSVQQIRYDDAIKVAPPQG